MNTYIEGDFYKKYFVNCKIIEERKGEIFQAQVQNLLDKGWYIESSSCNNKTWKAIMIKPSNYNIIKVLKCCCGILPQYFSEEDGKIYEVTDDGLLREVDEILFSREKIELINAFGLIERKLYTMK